MYFKDTLFRTVNNQVKKKEKKGKRKAVLEVEIIHVFILFSFPFRMVSKEIITLITEHLTKKAEQHLS